MHSCKCFFLPAKYNLDILFVFWPKQSFNFLQHVTPAILHDDPVCNYPLIIQGPHRSRHHGGRSSNALQHGGLRDFRLAASGLRRNRPLLRLLRGSPEDHAGVPAGRPQHALPSGVSFAAGHFSISGCHPWRPIGDLHTWHAVLVPGLLLLPGPAHPCTHFHSGFLSAPPQQRLRGSTIEIHLISLFERLESVTIWESKLVLLLMNQTGSVNE